MRPLCVGRDQEKWWMPFVLKCASALSNGTQQDTQLVLLVLEYELKATAYSETTLCCERSDYTRKGEMVNAFCAKVCVKLNRTVWPLSSVWDEIAHTKEKQCVPFVLKCNWKASKNSEITLCGESTDCTHKGERRLFIVLDFAKSTFLIKVAFLCESSG